MRLPVIPIAVVVVLLGGAYALVTSEGPPTLVMGAPNLTVLADIDGVETEVAIAPNRMSYAVIASGDLWLAAADGAVERLTNSPGGGIVSRLDSRRLRNNVHTWPRHVRDRPGNA